MARVRRKADDEGGMRERKKEKMAIAKAMSVAIGTARAASEPPARKGSRCTPR